MHYAASKGALVALTRSIAKNFAADGITAYIVAPAVGVWLYGHESWAAFAAIIGQCLAVVVIGWRSMARDVRA